MIEGLTHASSVIPLERCNEAESGIVTSALVPLNRNAPPYLPDAQAEERRRHLPDVTQVALLIVPLLPFPDASATVDPDPSSNPYAATRPDGAAIAGFDGAIASAVRWNGGLEQ